MGLNLGDVPDIIGLTPKIPYAGNTNADGLQESHGLGTDFLKTELKDLLALLDPTGTFLKADGAWNGILSPESKAGGMAIGSAVHSGKQQDAYNALVYDKEFR